jgi:hypothetical protein
MRYLFIIGLLVSLNVQAQKTMRIDRLYLNESIELKEVFSGDTLFFVVQNKVSGTGLSFSITNPSLSFDFSATDLGFFLNYINGDTSTFDVRANGVLLQWGVNDGNVGIGTEAPTEKLHVAGTSLFTDTLTYQDGTQADGYVLTSDASGNATWQDPDATPAARQSNSIAPVNGGSDTIPDNTEVFILSPASLLATYTITLPANPVTNQLLYIVSSGFGITALTLSPNTGQSIVGGITTLTANVNALYFFDGFVWIKL